MAICSWFSFWTLWFSTAMSVHQRVYYQLPHPKKKHRTVVTKILMAFNGVSIATHVNNQTFWHLQTTVFFIFNIHIFDLASTSTGQHHILQHPKISVKPRSVVHGGPRAVSFCNVAPSKAPGNTDPWFHRCNSLGFNGWTTDEGGEFSMVKRAVDPLKMWISVQAIL